MGGTDLEGTSFLGDFVEETAERREERGGEANTDNFWDDAYAAAAMGPASIQPAQAWQNTYRDVAMRKGSPYPVNVSSPSRDFAMRKGTPHLINGPAPPPDVARKEGIPYPKYVPAPSRDVETKKGTPFQHTAMTKGTTYPMPLTSPAAESRRSPKQIGWGDSSNN